MVPQRTIPTETCSVHKDFRFGWFDYGTRTSRRDISHSYNSNPIPSGCQLRTDPWGERYLGLDDLACLRMHLLTLDFAGVPAATERFHQDKRELTIRCRAIAFQPLARQERCLGCNNVQITGNSTDITIIAISTGRGARLRRQRPAS